MPPKPIRKPQKVISSSSEEETLPARKTDVKKSKKIYSSSSSSSEEETSPVRKTYAKKIIKKTPLKIIKKTREVYSSSSSEEETPKPVKIILPKTTLGKVVPSR